MLLTYVFNVKSNSNDWRKRITKPKNCIRRVRVFRRISSSCPIETSRRYLALRKINSQPNSVFASLKQPIWLTYHQPHVLNLHGATRYVLSAQNMNHEHKVCLSYADFFLSRFILIVNWIASIVNILDSVNNKHYTLTVSVASNTHR